MIFDTHAHYDDEAFEEDREALLLSMKSGGVGYIVNACASIDGMEKTIALMEKYPFVYGAVGVHPDDAGAMNKDVIKKLQKLCRPLKLLFLQNLDMQPKSYQTYIL